MFPTDLCGGRLAHCDPAGRNVRHQIQSGNSKLLTSSVSLIQNKTWFCGSYRARRRIKCVHLSYVSQLSLFLVFFVFLFLASEYELMWAVERNHTLHFLTEVQSVIMSPIQNEKNTRLSLHTPEWAQSVVFSFPEQSRPQTSCYFPPILLILSSSNIWSLHHHPS